MFLLAGIKIQCQNNYCVIKKSDGSVDFLRDEQFH